MWWVLPNPSAGIGVRDAPGARNFIDPSCVGRGPATGPAIPTERGSRQLISTTADDAFRP